MEEYQVYLWDEGIHVILETVTVRGTKKNIQRIKDEEKDGGMKFIVPSKGCPWEMTASEFIRRFKVD